MANVMFKKGLLAGLPSTYAEGTFYVTTDERAIYLDVSDSARIRLGDFQEFATLEALKANVNPSTSALYYISGLNVLAKWNGTDYVQINLDTGATSVEVVGSGNAVTAAAYDAATRKLTLTMGETFAKKSELDELDAFVGDIPEGYTEETVIAYINKKAEETLNAASGGSSESAASVLAALNTYKSTTDPRLEALEAIDHDHANKAELDLIASGDKAKWDAEIGSAAAIAAMKDGESIDSFADVEAALAGKQAVGDYATKAEAQGYANAKDEAIAAAKKAGDDAQSAVDTLAGKVGEVPADKTVVQMISDAQSAATYDDTALAARVSANEEAIDLLNDEATVAGSVDYKIAQAVAAIMENPDETMNSINELVTWVNDHAQDALELSNQVSANKDDIAALDELVGGTAVATQIAEAIAGALKIEGVDKYALAADLTAAIGRIAAMEAKVASWDAAEQNAKDYADDLDEAMDTRMQVVEGKAHEHANKAELDLIASGDKAKWDAAEAKAHEHANKTTLDGITDAKVAAWDAAEQNAKNYADGLAGNYATKAQGELADTALQPADIATGSANGTISVEGTDVAVKGLGSAAYTASTAYDAAGAAASALTEAKAYTDTALTWGSF